MRGRKKNLEYRNAVFKALVENEKLWVNKIGQLTGIPARTVTNILDEFSERGLIEDQDIARETSNKIKMRFVSLKNISQNELKRKVVAHKIIERFK